METLPGVNPRIKSLLYYYFKKSDLSYVTVTAQKEQIFSYKEQKCHLNLRDKGRCCEGAGLALVSLLKSLLLAGDWPAPSFLLPLGFQLAVSPNLSQLAEPQLCCHGEPACMLGVG